MFNAINNFPIKRSARERNKSKNIVLIIDVVFFPPTCTAYMRKECLCFKRGKWKIIENTKIELGVIKPEKREIQKS